MESVLWELRSVIPNAHPSETSKGANATGAIANRKRDWPVTTIPMQPMMIAASVTVTPDFFMTKLFPTKESM